MVIILFLLNSLTPQITFGFNFGHYLPTIYEFNEWLKDQNKGIIEGNFTLGAHFGVGIGPFAINISGDYFSNKSLYGDNKLILVPVDICLNYTYTLIPFFLYAYGGLGYTLCKIQYTEKTTEGYTTLVDDIGAVIPLRFSLKFTATKSFSTEILYGYRWTIEKMAPAVTDSSIYRLVGKDGKIVKELVPINIQGQFIRLSINREFW